MIKKFNILDRSQNIHSNYLLEASAGTGKTYSIENCIVRLLVDQKIPSTLESMLIVTFTKAATSDLKERIRSNLQRTLMSLDNLPYEQTPDYLKEIYEQGEDCLLYARQKLEQALSIFEQASIFTIHGFCNRMLKEYLFEGDLGATLGDSETGISSLLHERLIKDFFRLELHEGLVTQGQFQRLVSSLSSVERLEKELFLLIFRSVDIAPPLPLSTLFQEFCERLYHIRQNIHVTEEQLYADFECMAPYYNGICNRQGEIKIENVEKVKKLLAILFKENLTLSDFDLLIEDGLFLVEVFDPENANKKKKPPSFEELHCPKLIKLLGLLNPLITQARHPDFILCTLAHKCKQLVKAYLDQKEIFGYDDLLTSMHKAVQDPSFATKVHNRFTTAIIDEFQDTDPIQWQIFKTLFLSDQSHNSRLYLVGDPKQSIYGFRQADIYTYLAAGEALGEENRAFLSVNYRSTKAFVEAINALFSTSTAPGLMTLPRVKKTLPYQEVDSGGLIEDKCLEDGRGAIHFFSYEEKAKVKGEKSADSEESYFLPFIAAELLNLKEQGIAPSDCAVLVSDRFQAMRVMRYFKALSIPFVAQHAEDLADALAFEALREVLQGVIAPQNESALKVALGGPLIGWSRTELIALDDPYQLERVIAKAIALRKIWREEGFSACFQAFLSSSWLSSDETIAESLLRQDGGLDLYHGILQIAEILIEREGSERLSPQGLLDTFDKLSVLQKDKEKAVKLRTNPEKEGVRILTIHSSKGLEFEVVIALGVMKRSKKPSAVIPVVQEDGPPLLTVVEDPQDQRAIEYAMELDAEKIRQLYVAFTRAKHRLYIPLHFVRSGSKCERGTASPIELYLALMGQPDIQFQDIYERIENMQPQSSQDYIQQFTTKYSITLSTSQEECVFKLPKPNPEVIDLKEVLRPEIAKGSRYMHSFTSLSQAQQIGKAEALIVSPPNDFQAGEKNMHTLPAGSHTGVFLHFLFEKMSFSIAQEDLMEFVKQYVVNTLFEDWCQPLARMLNGALSVPLPFGNSYVTLKALNDKEMFREHEFTYDAKDFFHVEFESKPGFLKGVIDLIFMHEGKYGIIDWKSNWLGPDASHYTESNMHQAMGENDYFLQAKIYKEALRRYLRLIDDRPFEDIFAGVFYIFLRGVNEGVGVYTVKD